MILLAALVIPHPIPGLNQQLQHRRALPPAAVTVQIPQPKQQPVPVIQLETRARPGNNPADSSSSKYSRFTDRREVQSLQLSLRVFRNLVPPALKRYNPGRLTQDLEDPLSSSVWLTCHEDFASIAIHGD